MDHLAENYQLKWHSFNSYLHSSVAVALHNETFADVALVTVDGHQIMAHRFVLSVSSQFLHQILKFQPKVTTALPLMIVLPTEITYKTLKILLQYMYSGEATVSKDILESVLRGGDILKVKGLYRPKEDDQVEKKSSKLSQSSGSDCSSPSLEKPKPPPLTKYTSQPRVLNYSINVKKFNEKDGETSSKEDSNSPGKTQSKNGTENELSKSPEEKSPPYGNENNKKQIKSESDSSKLSDTLQFLVIKEEPIEWSEVAEADMELVDEKEVFSTEMTIKPEIYMEDAEENEGLYSPLTCELCTETFTLPAEWVRHVQTHTDMLPAKRQRRDRSNKEDENATYPALHCDMCQKYFPTPAEWVHHIQDTHTEFELHLSNKKLPQDSAPKDTKPATRAISNYQKTCLICKKMFPSHASMLIHRRTHTGEKPYMCEFCYKGFNVKSNLLRHLRTLHDKIINATDVEGSKEEEDGN